MPEYEAWKETAAPGWTIKYYKGLGTSDKKEAQEYFADIDLHRKTFVHEGNLLHHPFGLAALLQLACTNRGFMHETVGWDSYCHGRALSAQQSSM